MTQPSREPGVVTISKAWAYLMKTMAHTNGQRVKDARKAANALAADRRRF